MRLALILALCSSAALAGEPRKLVVFELRAEGLAAADKALVDVHGLSTAVREVALETLPDMDQMALEQITRLLEANGEDLAKCEAMCLAELGKKVSADLAVGGRLYRAGRLLKVSLELWDTGRGRLLAAGTAQGKDGEELDASLRKTAERVFGKLAPGAAPPVAEPVASAGDPALFDLSVDPCNDFYSYACGGWLKQTPIPAGKATWSRGFAEVARRNEALLQTILEEHAAGKRDAANPFAAKTGAFYAACMSDDGTKGLAFLREQVAAVAAIPNAAGLPAALGKLHAAGVEGFFETSVERDLHDATRRTLTLDQASLGLRRRESYVGDAGAKTRESYTAHMQAALRLAGVQQPEAVTKAALAIETELANAAMTAAARRDPSALDHPLDRAALQAKTPHFAWDPYFSGLGTRVTRVNLAAPATFEALDAILAKRPLADLRAYLTWQAVHAYGELAGKALREEHERFQALLGAQVATRSRRCVQLTDQLLGDALGRSYVERTLGPGGKRAATDVAQSVLRSARAALTNAAWMDDVSRKAAFEKLDKVALLLSHPDERTDYASLDVSRDNPAANVAKAHRFNLERDLAALGKPAAREDWRITPPTVNAYYDSSANALVFPAGILQPPFFATTAVAAANYAGFGMVFAHELTHAFDDGGRQFDAAGTLRDWWSPATASGWTSRAACVERQFGEYTAIDELKVNGKLTLGENAADLGGLKLALAAYRASAPKPDLRGFFVSYAQAWCTNTTPASRRQRAAADPHSPPQWRVNGAVSNLAEFQQAFSCAAGAPMAPVSRCTVW